MEREVEHTLEECYTTRQLVDELLSLDPGGDGKGGENRVLFTCSFGDYARTRQALPVSEVEDGCTSELADTAYSQSGICHLEDRDPHDEPMPEPDDDDLSVIILSS